jgi:hypothetical protein
MAGWLGLRRFLELRRRGKKVPIERAGSYVADVEWQRSEELRPDRLGPSQDDVIDPEPVRDPWRPSRTLGPIPKK